jgi:hypothetical protein
MFLINLGRFLVHLGPRLLAAGLRRFGANGRKRSVRNACDFKYARTRGCGY